MKELRRNMRLVGMLVVVAFIGLSAWFALTVFEQGSHLGLGPATTPV